MLSEPQDDARIRAFRELYRGEFAFVWATARRLGVPPAQVEDAVQDVFLTAYRRLDQVHFEVSPRAWLHGVTRRITARYRRSAARLTRRMAAVAAVPRGPAEPPQERIVTADQLERLLAGLSADTRAAFEMSELIGMSGPEIASELKIPVATVYSRVRLAREQLVRQLGAARLERELASARAHDAPPPAAAQRSWAALLPGLLSPRTGLGLAALASVRTAVMTTLVVAGGVVAVAWPREPAQEPAREAPAVHGAAVPDTASEASAAALDAPDEPTPLAPPPEAPSPAAPRLSDADRLAAEVALLDRARAGLARGDAESTLAHLAEHARRFPAGAFTDLRGATEVEVLCLQGKPGEAAARAAALVAAHPRSAVAQRFANFSCPR